MGVLTQLGSDGAGVLTDDESGEVYGFALELLGSAHGQNLADGTLVRFWLNKDGDVGLVETQESLLRLAASLELIPNRPN